ncbi:hypothetical protein LCGC14_2031820 [marine sediment metagenome]|uniref:Uncharacterized protein n=1 Tax=marine sediment metagenome TaxID=412755 RepID=A0A0F9EUQ4_9ZZZZ
MQQEQRPPNRIGHTEAFVQKVRHVSTPSWPAGLIQQLLKFRFPIAGQLGGLAGGLLGPQRADAIVAIGIHPALNESAAAIEAKANLRLAQTFQGQQDRAIPIPLFGVWFLSDQLTKGHKFLWAMQRYLHDGFLSDGGITAE